VIRKVHFKNFRCLRDVELTLEPLTVLVGPNSSGKTTVLEGLRPRTGLGRPDLWRQEVPEEAFIKCFYADGTIGNVGLYHHGSRAHGYRHSLQPLSLDLKALRSPNLLAQAQ
jgi:hypothetical protein